MPSGRARQRHGHLDRLLAGRHARPEGAGLPSFDSSDASVRLVARPSGEDFGVNAAHFAPNGVMER
jgi:hypothetical protein